MSLLSVALLEPEIPPNTGNIARSCAATGVPLHLIGRLGFSMEDRYLRRAGIDYWDAVTVVLHDSFAGFETAHPGRIVCLSAHVTRPYTAMRFQPGDALLFGSESRGLPKTILDRYADQALTIPMPSGAVRSLNLATSVGIVLYEALRQLHGW